LQVISQDVVQVMSGLLNVTDTALLSSVCTFFDNLATMRPDAVQPLDGKFISMLNADSDFSSPAAAVLVKLATDSVRFDSRSRWRKRAVCSIYTQVVRTI
jgi:hypothetical protein